MKLSLAAFVGIALLAAAAIVLRSTVRLAPDYADPDQEVYTLYAALTVACVVLLVKRPPWAAFPAIACLAMLHSCPASMDGHRLMLRSISCANHALQWGAMIPRVAEAAAARQPDAAFPDTDEFDEILTWAGVNGNEPGWRESFYCPGRVDTRLRTGYVFVGGGLAMRDVTDRTLLAFCAAECHPRPGLDRHALVRHGIECADGPRLLEMIEEALRSSTKYSARARSRLEEERDKLRKR